jgi:hypothetical protein
MKSDPPFFAKGGPRPDSGVSIVFDTTASATPDCTTVSAECRGANVPAFIRIVAETPHRGSLSCAFF